MSTLKVNGLTYRTAEKEVERLFDKYGKINEVFIPKDRFSRKSRGFAFVRFVNKEDARNAYDDLDRRMFDGRELRIEWSKKDGGNERRAARSSRDKSMSPRRRSHSRERRRSRSRSHPPLPSSRSRGEDRGGGGSYSDKDRRRIPDRDRSRSRSPPPPPRSRGGDRWGGSYNDKDRRRNPDMRDSRGDVRDDRDSRVSREERSHNYENRRMRSGDKRRSFSRERSPARRY